MLDLLIYWTKKIRVKILIEPLEDSHFVKTNDHTSNTILFSIKITDISSDSNYQIYGILFLMHYAIPREVPINLNFNMQYTGRSEMLKLYLCSFNRNYLQIRIRLHGYDTRYNHYRKRLTVVMRDDIESLPS